MSKCGCLCVPCVCVCVCVCACIGQQISLDSDKPRRLDTFGPKPFDGVPAVDELMPLVLLSVSMGMILHFKTLAAVGMLIVLANGAGAITLTSQLLAMRQWIHQSPPVHRPIFSTIEHLPPPRVRCRTSQLILITPLPRASVLHRQRYHQHCLFMYEHARFCSGVASGVCRHAYGMRNRIGGGSVLVRPVSLVGTRP
jgi:hypothetical protein